MKRAPLVSFSSFLSAITLHHSATMPSVTSFKSGFSSSAEYQMPNGVEHYYIRYSPKFRNKFYKCHKDKVGCGAGNTIFPLIRAYPKLFVHACDFSPEAVNLVKVFVLSAVSPTKMFLVLQNLKRVLKPNGHVLLRDYAVGDFAQVKLQSRKQIIAENFYFREDGTCSFYFSESFLSLLFVRWGFKVVDVNIYCRHIANHSKNITISRRWIRAIFSKL